MKKTILTTVLMLILGVYLSHSQSATDITASLDGDRIKITYNLESSTQKGHIVKVYSSFDGYQKALTKVTGDAGSNITPGANKTVYWDYKSEYPGKTINEIDFKIEATLPRNKNKVISGCLITSGVIGGIVLISLLVYAFYY